MKRLKGPELKVPTVFADLYYDLRDRRLLPLIALLLVAAAAVPFLLGSDGEKLSPATLGAGAVEAPETSGAEATNLTVVEARPGLRDFRKRLRRRTPTDPFVPQHLEPVSGEGGSESGSGATSSSGGGSSSAGSTGTSSTGTSSTGTPSTGTSSGGGSKHGSSGGAPSETSPSSGGGSGKPGLTYYTFAIDVSISRQGGEDAAKSKQEPAVKHDVLPQTALPGEKAPVVTYMGLARKGKKATGKVLLLASPDVSSVTGEKKCLSRGETCQLLEVEPGFPITFVYGANEVSYTVKVLKIHLVVTGHS